MHEYRKYKMQETRTKQLIIIIITKHLTWDITLYVTNCDYKIAATLLTLETWPVSVT